MQPPACFPAGFLNMPPKHVTHVARLQGEVEELRAQNMVLEAELANANYALRLAARVAAQEYALEYLAGLERSICEQYIHQAEEATHRAMASVDQLLREAGPLSLNATVERTLRETPVDTAGVAEWHWVLAEFVASLNPQPPDWQRTAAEQRIRDAAVWHCACEVDPADETLFLAKLMGSFEPQMKGKPQLHSRLKHAVRQLLGVFPSETQRQTAERGFSRSRPRRAPSRRKKAIDAPPGLEPPPTDSELSVGDVTTAVLESLSSPQAQASGSHAWIQDAESRVRSASP